MKTKFTRSLIAVFTLVWTTLLTISPAQGQAVDNHGEEYFLIRTLEFLYEQWPQDVSKPAEFASASAELRREAIRFKVRAEQAKLHSSVIDGFADFVAQLDAYTAFLSNLDVIKNDASNRKNKEQIASLASGGLAGVNTYGVLSQNENVSGEDALTASLIVGGLTCAYDSWMKSGARDEAARNAVNAEAQRIEDQFTATLERSRQRFVDLAETKGWGKHEIGWNLSSDDAQAVTKMLDKGDLKGLTTELARQRTARPFDSFVALRYIFFEAYQNTENLAALDRLSADSFSIKKLIPPDDVYTDYRLSAVSQAANLADLARYLERKNGASPRSSDRSKRAVEIWEEFFRLQPSDPTGRNRMYRAMAYASDGDTAKAWRELKLIFDLLQKDGEYLYACSWILCLEGNYDLSLESLKWALRTDTLKVSNVRIDHNLADLRKQRHNEFQKLTTPQWQWNIKDGSFFSDVSFTNNSAFTLTNIKLVSATTGWNPDLTIKSLRPGETEKWGWVSKPPAGENPKLQLNSDQSP